MSLNYASIAFHGVKQNTFPPFFKVCNHDGTTHVVEITEQLNECTFAKKYQAPFFKKFCLLGRAKCKQWEFPHYFSFSEEFSTLLKLGEKYAVCLPNFSQNINTMAQNQTIHVCEINNSNAQVESLIRFDFLNITQFVF